MTKRMIYCDWCGEELGVCDDAMDEIESRGKPECNRYQQNTYRARDVCTREAEQDNYNRYR